jgi:transposase InsO family protein
VQPAQSPHDEPGRDFTYITYITLGEGFVYLAVLMDVFTRACKPACAPSPAGSCRGAWMAI